MTRPCCAAGPPGYARFGPEMSLPESAGTRLR
jgi:hypothetical protein